MARQKNRPRFLHVPAVAVTWSIHHLTEEQREIQSLARDFAQREIAPYAAELDHESRFDPSLRVNIITPVRIDVLTPTGEIETVTDGATAAKPATPGKEPQSVVPDEIK